MRKSFDSFCPMGPYLTTADEVPRHDDIDLELSVNGELRQKANTRDLIVGVAEMIAMASSVMTLYPGDIIASGTPAGVGRFVRTWGRPGGWGQSAAISFAAPWVRFWWCSSA